LTQDHLGSPRIITDNTGKVIARKDFGAFGDETYTNQRTEQLGYKPEEVRQDYTGYQKDDESGLEFAQTRYYNTKHGRFTSVDPLTASANVKDPQTFNRYSYAMNSPYKFTDPLGLAARPRQSSLVDAGAIASDARMAPARGTDPIVTGGRANSTPASAQATDPPSANQPRLPAPIDSSLEGIPDSQNPDNLRKGADIFDTGLSSTSAATNSIPFRLVEKSRKDVNTNGTVSSSINYQTVDQNGKPFNVTSDFSVSEADPYVAVEEITPLPGNTCGNIVGCDPNKILTGASDLNSGSFPDKIFFTTGTSGIRVPDDFVVRSLQKISIVNTDTGVENIVRLNYIEINRSGVIVKDITNTGINVPR
jgi:RHS repeat-associated protein